MDSRSEKYQAYKLQTSSEIAKVGCIYYPYTDKGSVVFHLRFSGAMLARQAILDLLAEEKIMPIEPVAQFNIEIHPHDFRGAIECLYQNKKMAEEDYTNIVTGPLKIIEAGLHIHDKLVEEITSAQSDNIHHVIGLYIDDIFEVVKETKSDLNTTLNIINLAFFINHNFPKEEGLQRFAKFDDTTVTRLCDAFFPIARAFNGIDLESTLENFGKGIPTLAIQRKVMIDYMKQKLAEHFPELGRHRATRFMVALAFNLWLLWPASSGGRTYGYYKSREKIDTLSDLRKQHEHKNPILKSRFISHEVFLKAIALTYKDTGLSIRKLKTDKNEKSLIAAAYKDTWRKLQEKNKVSQRFTQEEQKWCWKVYKDLFTLLKRHPLSQPGSPAFFAADPADAQTTQDSEQQTSAPHSSPRSENS